MLLKVPREGDLGGSGLGYKRKIQKSPLLRLILSGVLFISLGQDITHLPQGGAKFRFLAQWNR